MKIMETIKGKKYCCLQRYDAAFLASGAISVPDKLLKEISEQSPDSSPRNDDDYRFECVIARPENVVWLEKQEYIVDYAKYGRMDASKVEEVIRRIKRDFEAEVGQYNTATRSHRELYYDDMGRRIEMKRHEVASLELLVQYLDEKIDFVFPDEIYKEFRTGILDQIRDFGRRVIEKTTALFSA